MEVLISKVPNKYVPESLIKELFSIVGHVGHIRSVEDNNEGECTYRLTFMNPSEAMKAACLDQVELGDRKLQVKRLLDHDMDRKMRLHNEDFVKQCKTLFISNIDSIEQLLVGLSGIIHTVQLADNKKWLVEFESRALSMEALIRIRTRRISEAQVYGMVLAEEAVRVLYDLTISNSSKETVEGRDVRHRRDDHDDRHQSHSSRRHYDSRDRDRYRRRSRSRSRSPYSRRRH